MLKACDGIIRHGLSCCQKKKMTYMTSKPKKDCQVKQFLLFRTIREEDIMRPIPRNFAMDGTVVGKVTWKRAIETAIVIIGMGLPICKLAPISIKAKIYLCVIFVLPSAIFSIRGVYEMSLFSFVCTFFKFMANRRISTFPDSKAEINRERNLLAKKKKKMDLIKKEEKERIREQKKRERAAKRRRVIDEDNEDEE